jgi:hypothetical protein
MVIALAAALAGLAGGYLFGRSSESTGARPIGRVDLVDPAGDVTGRAPEGAAAKSSHLDWLDLRRVRLTSNGSTLHIRLLFAADLPRRLRTDEGPEQFGVSLEFEQANEKVYRVHVELEPTGDWVARVSDLQASRAYSGSIDIVAEARCLEIGHATSCRACLERATHWRA